MSASATVASSASDKCNYVNLCAGERGSVGEHREGLDPATAHPQAASHGRNHCPSRNLLKKFGEIFRGPRVGHNFLKLAA